MKTRLFLAITQRAVRELLALALRSEGHYEIVGEAGRGMEVVETCIAHPPDVVITDSKFSDLAVAEMVRRLRREAPTVRVLVFSGSRDGDVSREVLAARPHGFVHREEPLNEFYEALRAVSRGTRFYSSVASKLLDAPSDVVPRRSDAPAPQVNGQRLTPREVEVLTLLAHGRSNKEIGTELGLSVKTVDHYRADLMSKLDIHDVAGLTRYAVSAGLVKPGR